MFNVEERVMLSGNGFKSDMICDGLGGEEFEVYCREDWVICKSENEVKEVVEGYNNGCRVCWMNVDRYVDGLEFVLENVCDSGVWLCGSVEECLSIIEEEEY